MTSKWRSRSLVIWLTFYYMNSTVRVLRPTVFDFQHSNILNLATTVDDIYDLAKVRRPNVPCWLANARENNIRPTKLSSFLASSAWNLDTEGDRSEKSWMLMQPVSILSDIQLEASAAWLTIGRRWHGSWLAERHGPGPKHFKLFGDSCCLTARWRGVCRWHSQACSWLMPDGWIYRCRHKDVS